MSGHDLRTIGVLGGMSSESTVEYDRLIDRGINDVRGGHSAGDVVVPGPSDRDAVDDIIFEELTDGVIREESRSTYLDVIDSLTEQGAEGLVLGCTEIELLVEQADRPAVPMFDTTALHVERAVEWSLEGGGGPDN